MKLFLVRHGETAWNRGRRFQGARSNASLNQTGIEQADRLAALMKQEKLDSIYSSPLKRAMDTAQAIARECQLTVRVLPELREIDAGDLDGLSEREMGNRHLAFWTEWNKGDPAMRLPGGESLDDVQNRAWWAVERMLERHIDGSAVAVGHMFTNLVIIAIALGMPLQQVFRLRQDTAAVNIVEFSSLRNVLVLLNDTCHLTE